MSTIAARMRAIRKRLVELCARSLHLLLRETAVLLQEAGEILGRVAHRLEAEIGEVLLAKFRRAHDLARLCRRLRDELARRAGGGGKPEREGGIEVGQPGLGEGRHVRDKRVSRLSGDGE